MTMAQTESEIARRIARRKNQAQRRYGMGVLAALLIIVYTLTNAGKFHIVDEVSLFALTESVALRGAMDTNAIAWTQWVNSPGEVLGAFGPDGQVFSKKGPAPALLAVPWYVLLRWLASANVQIGLLQGALLWNGIVTAWTALLLWQVALRLGYDDRTGVILGLLYGLCTIAWPYANHFFGEPLSALSLLACFYGVLTFQQTGRMGWLWLAGVGAGLVVATVTAHVVLIGILGLAVVFSLAAGGSWRMEDEGLKLAISYAPRATRLLSATRQLPRMLYGLAAFAAPIAAAGAFLLWYNFVRFGDPFATGYHFDSGEGFTTPIVQGLWGLLLSPYRGVFWHTPLFLASLLAGATFVRRHPFAGWLCVALSVALIGLYSMWWMWWGGFAWGPRFLVPLAPFWVLLLAPWVADGGWRMAGGRWRMAGVWLLIGASFVVQVLAVVVNYANYELHLRKVFPTDWSNPLAFGPPAQRLADWRYSPVLGQWQLMRENFVANADLAWLGADGALHWLTPLIGLAALCTVSLLFASWWSNAGVHPEAGAPWARRGHPQKGAPTLPSPPIRLGPLLLAALVMGIWLSDSSRDLFYGAPDEGYRAILAEVCTHASPTDAVVSLATYHYHIPMNWIGGLCEKGTPIFGYAASNMVYPEAQQVLGRMMQVYKRIWFVTYGVVANDPENGVERWLATNAFKADDRWYGDFRLVRYATPIMLQQAANLPLDLFFTDGQGHQVTIWSVRAPAEAAASEILPVEIVYWLDSPVRANLRWFVQMLTLEGQPVALLDTAPDQGYSSFSRLPDGLELVERAALQLPERLAPGRYLLIAGLYNPELPDAPRLAAANGRDFVELGTVQVR
jgi:hypothetical protein